MNSSKEIASKMEIEPIFREKRIIRRKKQFDENVKMRQHNPLKNILELIIFYI